MNPVHYKSVSAHKKRLISAHQALGMKRGDTVKRSRVPYIFLIPFFLSFLIFGAFPLGFAFYISFTNWQFRPPIWGGQWVGLENYARAFSDKDWMLALQHTFTYVLYEPVTIFIGLVLALVLNSAIKGRSVFRTIFFLPVVTSTVAIAFVWTWLYDYERGPFNVILRLFGLPAQTWLGPQNALYAVMLMSIWQWMGLNAIIFLAALQSIPNEYHEAARMSGAGAWNTFRHVTAPLLKPSILFCIVTATAGSLQVFTEVYVLTRETLTTTVAVQYIYRQAFSYLNFGYGAALAIILFLIILVIALIEFRLMRRGGMVYY